MRRVWIVCIVAALPLTFVCSSAISSSYALASSEGHAFRPMVSDVPELGPDRGGTAITITGNGFVQGDSVVIGQGHGAGAGAIAATEVSVVSSTQVTATTGGGARPGPWNLWVIAPDGSTSHAVSGDTFTYIATATNSLVVTKLGSSTGDYAEANTMGPWLQHVVYDGSYGIFAVYPHNPDQRG